MLGAIRRFFRGPSEGPFFLGLQLVVDGRAEPEVWRRLVALFTRPRPETESPAETGNFIRSAVALLLQLEPHWTYAFWDYVDDQPARARVEYKTWTQDIKAGRVLDEAEKGAPDAEASLPVTRRYGVASLVFLLAEPYTFAEITDEDLFFKRPTLRLLVENLVRIDPGQLKATGAFVLPNTADDGFTEEEMLDPSWSYLRELWG